MTYPNSIVAASGTQYTFKQTYYGVTDKMVTFHPKVSKNVLNLDKAVVLPAQGPNNYETHM